MEDSRDIMAAMIAASEAPDLPAWDEADWCDDPNDGQFDRAEYYSQFRDDEIGCPCLEYVDVCTCKPRS